MNFISKAATFVGAVTLAVSSFALSNNIERCPSIDAVKAQGISMVLPIDFDFYIGMETSNYDTDNEWAFLIGPIQSDDYDVAVELANDALTNVSGSPEPQEDQGFTVCEYNSNSDELAAVAVATDGMISTQKIKHLFHK